MGVLERSRAWLGFSWAFLIPNLCSMTTRTWSTRRTSLRSSVTITPSPASRRTQRDNMYIQTKIAEYAQEVWDLMQSKKTHLYICGLKGMEKGIAEVLGPIAESKGLVYTDLVKEWKKEGRWHVEVY